MPSHLSAVPVTTVSVKTRNAAETQAFAAHLAAAARAGDRLALIGPLGAGKTQFAKGFARGLGVTVTVNSPSFTLMAEYQGRLPLFHQDLYRLAGSGEALDGGLLDERQDWGVTLTEWAERLDADLDPGRVDVRLRILGDEEREISVTGGGVASRYIRAAMAWQADARKAAAGAGNATANEGTGAAEGKPNPNDGTGAASPPEAAS